MLRKRLLALLLALATVFMLCACGQAAGPEKVSDTLPEEFSGRKLSDEELLPLSAWDREGLRTAISTLEDAVAWVNLHWTVSGDLSAMGTGEYPYCTFVKSATELLDESIGREELCVDEGVRLVAWLLQDDTPGLGLLVHIAPGDGHIELLCIPEGDGWHLVNVGRMFPATWWTSNLYQFTKRLDGVIYGWDSEAGERALLTDLERPIVFYEKPKDKNGEEFYAFLGREYLTMLRERPAEELALLPSEEESERFAAWAISCIPDYFGFMLPPDSLLTNFGARRVDEAERAALGGRRLSGAELIALDCHDAEVLRAALSTPEDVAAWLKLQNFDFWDSAWISNSPMSSYAFFPTADFMLNPSGLTDEVETYIGRDSVNLLAAWLLQDDYEDCGAILLLVPDNPYGFINDSALCIPHDGEYFLFNLETMIDLTTEMDRSGDVDILDGVAIRDLGLLTDYIDSCRGKDLVQHGEIALIRDLEQPVCYVTYGPWACFQDRSGVLYAQQPDETVEEYTLRHGAKGQEWAFLDFDIGAFDVPDALSGCLLSDAEIEALVGQDVDLVAQKVNTVEDLIRYLHAGRFTFGGGGDIWQDDAEDDDLTWHFNKTARTANLTRDIDCGATANLVQRLLDGDYERVGFVAHTYLNGDGGGHVYNYVYEDGKYYVMDMTQITGSGYQPGALRILELDDLSEFPRELVYSFGSPYSGYGDEFAAIYAYDAEPDIPVGWGKGEDGCTVTWCPAGAELQILYENRENGYSVDFRDVPAETAEAIALARTDGMANSGYFRADAFPGVEAYGFPAAFGEATLSFDEMLSLVWTADMETLAEKIKTIPDLMMYFHAAGYHGRGSEIGGGGSDIHVDAEGGGVIWHYNEYAERTRWQSAHALRPVRGHGALHARRRL